MFFFTETDIIDYVKDYIKNQDLNGNKRQDKKIKDCAWTEIQITQQVKPFESEDQARMILKYIVKRFHKQHYCGGLI